MLEYRRDHLAVFWRAYRALGPVFSLRFGPQLMAVLIGPEAHRFFFTQADKILSLPEVYRFVIPMFGRVLNAADDPEIRHGHLALLHSAFHPRLMERHVGTMVRETVEWLDQLGEHGEIELNEQFSSLVMRIAASALMGPEIRRRLGEFIPLFHDLARGMDFVLPPNLPLPRFRRRDRARDNLRELIAPIISHRRSGLGGGSDDFFQVIISGNYLDPASRESAETNETIIGLALLTAFTAYIATAAQTCWSLVQLLQNPAYLRMVEAERAETFGESCADDLSVATLQRLEKLDWALKESQRMHPVMTHYARFNAESYEFGGYEIPARWMTVVCAAIAHRDPDLFPDPDTSDPQRFGPERQEDRKHPYALIGFGAGLYRCPGAAFGTNEMKVILSLLTERYDLELRVPAPQADFEMGVVRPKLPCWVAYRRRPPRRTVFPSWVGSRPGEGKLRPARVDREHSAHPAVLCPHANQARGVSEV